MQRTSIRLMHCTRYATAHYLHYAASGCITLHQAIHGILLAHCTRCM
ncbi:hypothetical protein HMPREF3190_00740 [Umbribacter vaginalis]|nr:hypothetical protein HMPREF3190_00740 [Coriobacteriales bacterium DNF00809]